MSSGNDIELRDDVISRVKAHIFPLDLGIEDEQALAESLADDILALPEIAGALQRRMP